MKRLLIFIPLLCLSHSLALASVKNNLALVAQDSIYQFFLTSSREVASVKIESYNKLTAAGLDYLVEADVKAQSPVSPIYIQYHCGVFIKKDGFQWVTQQTVCEALPATSF